MPANPSLWETSVGKKIAMAGTGLVLVGFVLGHMAGNLKAFLGREAFNHYAEFLRSMGEPLLPHGVALWIVRGVLLLAVAVHAGAAVRLARTSRAARPQKYHQQTSQTFTFASRTMRWGGLALALFIVFHLLHLTIGILHPSFVRGDAYANVVIGFSSPLLVLVYGLAMGALSLHVYHGVWSVFQTLGFVGDYQGGWRRAVAAAAAVALFVGFMAVPLGVVTGIVALP